jgi:NADH-quinone oxidoreductase subunit G
VLVVDTELIEESPILDLRVRKAIRRNGVRLVVATSRTSTLDPNADAVIRFAPGAGEGALAALAAAGGGTLDLEDLARRGGTSSEEVSAAGNVLREGGPVVILWGERLSEGERGGQAVGALLALTRALDLPGTDGAGLIEVPRAMNGRGLREVGCVPNMLPGLADQGLAAKEAGAIAAALGDGSLSALLLLHADPLATHPDRGAWQGGLERADFVVAFADFADGIERHADVIFPAESYAEREGTVTHPDGRLQRLRQAVAHPDQVRPVWQVLLELAGRLGSPLELPTAPLLTARMVEAVPFSAGLTLDEIGGRGIRWQEREAASALPGAELPEPPLELPPELPAGLRLGTVPSLWSGRETRHAPVLRFLAPQQRAELAEEDARRLGIAPGDEIVVTANGTSLRARAAVRAALPSGSVFLVEGTDEQNVNALSNGGARLVEVRKA